MIAAKQARKYKTVLFSLGKEGQNMLKQLRQTIETYHLITPGQRVLVAVSGGRDSLALLHGLHQLQSIFNCTVIAAHFNHGMRGEASDGDEAFVKRFCQERGILCVTTKEDLRQRENGMNFQNFARERRYLWLRQQKEKLEAHCIAVAHHAQDQGETVLLHLFRGAGTAGLAAMSPQCGDIIRPLLMVDRSAITAYCEAQGLVWREDASNAKTVYRRNAIRLELWQQLTSYNPRLREALCTTADICRAEDQLLEKLSIEAYQKLRLPGDVVTLSWSGLTGLPLALKRRVLRLAWQELTSQKQGLSFQQVEKALALEEGKRVEWPGERWVLRQKDNLLFTSIPPKAKEILLWQSLPQPVPGELCLPEAGMLAKAYYGPAPVVPLPERGSLFAVPAAWCGAFSWRNRRQGDRLHPRGMQGRQKLKKIFNAYQVPQEIRDNLPLLLYEDRLLWLPGYRMGETGPFGDGQALYFELQSLCGKSN